MGGVFLLFAGGSLSLFFIIILTQVAFKFTGPDSSRGRLGCQSFDTQPGHSKGVKNGSAKIRNGQFLAKWGEMCNFWAKGGEMGNFLGKMGMSYRVMA